jgi:hypothetical protein
MHSLTAPSDRVPVTEYTAKNTVEPLSGDALDAAIRTLSKNISFAQVDRYYADPAQINQRIALVSFTPSKGATPDKDNIYGMMKVRGVYATEEEANERAEWLIKNVDSYHEIYHAFVGRPFPVTTSEGFSRDIKKIDIRKKTTDVISQDILAKKEAERQDMIDIKQREQNLLDESKRAQNDEPRDPFEEYITEQVKRAQLVWTFHETQKKLGQMRDGFNKATARIRELDAANADFVDRYKEKYMEARRASGLADDNESFIKYLGLDLAVEIEDAPASFV